MTPASFINLDLVLNSAIDLTELATFLSRHAFILFYGEAAEEYKLVAEPVLEGTSSQNAIACTERFLSLLSALPSGLSELWQQCSSRIFDYGFEGGLGHSPLEVTLPSDALARMAELGIDLKVTVYSSRES